MAQFTTIYIQLSKAPYILLPRHTCTHQHILNSPKEHTTRRQSTSHGGSVYNSFLCVLPGFHLRLSEPEHISGTNLAQGL